MSRPPKVSFATDSSLEGTRFELSVPPTRKDIYAAHHIGVCTPSTSSSHSSRRWGCSSRKPRRPVGVNSYGDLSHRKAATMIREMLQKGFVPSASRRDQTTMPMQPLEFTPKST